MTQAKQAIGVGDRLPSATFITMTAHGPVAKTTSEIFSARKIVLFAVPGAFTPTCHRAHLPGFLETADAFRAKGVDEIVCTAVNDVHVINAWAHTSEAAGRITFLADGSAAFARAIGMDVDLNDHGMGIRSKRYAMLVDDGVVRICHVEDQAAQVDVSSAAQLLRAMT